MWIRLVVLLIALITSGSVCAFARVPSDTDAILRFASSTLQGWTVENEQTWRISLNPPFFSPQGVQPGYVVNSLEAGESNTGTLRSPVFTIRTPIQRFLIAGWDGTLNAQNDGDRNWVLLRSYPDGAILRRAHTPGSNTLTPVKWVTADLIGRQVYLEVIDGNPVIRPGGFAWIAFADYRQEDLPTAKPVERNDLYAVPIDEGAEMVLCRSIPFLAAMPERRGISRRQVEGHRETIPVYAQAETLYLLGMMNEGWDYGVAHWGEHPELREKRDDLLYVGASIGELLIHYEDGTSDRVPLVIGATAWFVAQWAHGPTHSVSVPIREPFASRPEYMRILRRALRLRESEEVATSDTRHAHYYLAIRPRPKRIEGITVIDNPDVRGRPLISAVTLVSAQPEANLKPFGRWRADADDLKPAFASYRVPNWIADLDALARALYTSTEDLPRRVPLLPFPEDADVARIRFLGGREADMLTNIWTANILQMMEKFESSTGFFRETGKDCPWYGGYSGIGTWAPVGVYAEGAYGRSSDHYATLVLRCAYDDARRTNYVDFCDRWLYFYRANRDPAQGPPNEPLDISRYPKDAPPHWAFVMNGPYSLPWPINEIDGNEEMEGHAATMVGRWVAWRMLGAPTEEWLTAPRPHVYGKSRWDSTRDAAEFVCWFMDYTGRDVIFSEGEVTGWGGGPHLPLCPPGMSRETDPEKIRRNYANADMYEPYATYTCMVALRCSAQIADALGERELASRWRAYADRLQAGMVRLLKVGDHNNLCWRVSPYSVLPSLQDSLVQAWFSIYLDGYDPGRWDSMMTSITRNTLRRQLSQRYGHAPVLAMGYGQGWLTHAALMLDEMDDAGKLLWNLAKYTYDKNMDYVDPQRGIDWRKWLWIIPEGTCILPNGMWYRIGDLSNGANQGPAMHALEACAGIDDTDPQHVRILPRAPSPLAGIEVENFPVLIPAEKGLQVARLRYSWRKGGTFTLSCDKPIPLLSVRLGPFASEEDARRWLQTNTLPSGAKTRLQASGHADGKPAWWVWFEEMHTVSQIQCSPDRRTKTR